MAEPPRRGAGEIARLERPASASAHLLTPERLSNFEPRVGRSDSAPTARPQVVGWDIGGAHVKACLLQGGQVQDVAQWACPLWQGLALLDAVLQRAALRWPELARAHHAVTMTGEMADLFETREDGVRRISATLLRHWPADRVRFFAGSVADTRSVAEAATLSADWCDADGVALHWPRIASANWLATALHLASVAAVADDARAAHGGLLVDIGSTTTDIVAFAGGRVLTTARSDAERLASGELVYHGVVRTPLCALGPRIAFQGVERNLMNELFATTADVYRLTGELNSDHDQQPAADNAAKDVPATQRRLARMIGADARDAPAADWLALARAWRARQLALLHGNLARVAAAHGLAPNAPLVSAGCGDFLVPGLAAGLPLAGMCATEWQPGDRADDAEDGLPARRAGRPCSRYAQWVAGSPAGLATRLQLCAPSVAVALLFDRDHPAGGCRPGV